MDLKKQQQLWENVYQNDQAKLPWLKNQLPIEVLDKLCKYLKSNNKVLDYGCGDGLLAEYLVDKGLNVICSEISQNALNRVHERLPTVKTIRAGTPNEIMPIENDFDGMIVWGVMHHIDTSFWNDYVEGFIKLLKPQGYMLIGGHSKKDPEFKDGFRISPTTGEISYAVNDLEKLITNKKLTILESNYFDFEEAYTGKQRSFKYFLIKNSA